MPNQKTETETENEKRIREAIQCAEHLTYTLSNGYYAETYKNQYAIRELKDLKDILRGNLEYEVVE